jgi:hypothetical protein
MERRRSVKPSTGTRDAPPRQSKDTLVGKKLQCVLGIVSVGALAVGRGERWLSLIGCQSEGLQETGAAASAPQPIPWKVLKIEWQDFILAGERQWYCDPNGLFIADALMTSQDADADGDMLASVGRRDNLYGTRLDFRWGITAGKGLEVQAKCSWWTDAVAEGRPSNDNGTIQGGTVYLAPQVEAGVTHVKFVVDVDLPYGRSVIMGGLIIQDSKGFSAAKLNNIGVGK